MSIIDHYLENNRGYKTNGGHGALPLPPSQHVAVVACMDARLDVYRILGLKEGEAHVIRNAGGVVTEDALRSLVISQRLLGTTDIILIHHTDCGMLTFSDDGVRAKIAAEVGFKPLFALQAFPNLDEDVREGINRIKANPFIVHKDNVRGFVFDVATGQLKEVVAEPARV
jgi:carbonic anhydrase